MSQYQAVIGLEVHAELATRSKMFCGCENVFAAEPNTRCCPVCLGMPGVLPVANRRAVELVIATALALNCEISRKCRFARKNYFYPDLPKNYQISQYEEPISFCGWIEIDCDGKTKRIGITRVHLEEDTGKLFHTDRGTSLLDFNRCGVPLMEIVTEPDFTSGAEARAYLTKLRGILQYLGASGASMEEGKLRCEPNVSVRRAGTAELGVKVEIKNLASVRAVEQGIDYEVRRQVQALERGEAIVQETRLWDEARKATAVMRTKEFASDYRYFPEPDLVLMEISEEWVERVRAVLPELPEQRRDRFIREYGLPAHDAALLTEQKSVAQFYEEAVGEGGEPKAVSNWVTGEVFRLLNLAGVDITQARVAPKALVRLLSLQVEGAITGTIAKTVFEEMFKTGKGPDEIVQAKGLTQISDRDRLRQVVREVIAANPDVAEKARAGQEKVKAFLVGQAMKATQGRANPQAVKEILDEEL